MDGKAAGHAERLAGSQSSQDSDASLHRQRLIFLDLFFFGNLFPPLFFFNYYYFFRKH